jgi:hypothetical protein
VLTNLADWVPSYEVAEGVYGGYVVLCLRCKGMTYIPNCVFQWDRVNQHMIDHNQWCPAYIDMALALIR